LADHIMAAFLFNLDGDAENYREALKLNPGCLPEARNWLREQAEERQIRPETPQGRRRRPE
jgi:hypothetical protein